MLNSTICIKNLKWIKVPSIPLQHSIPPQVIEIGEMFPLDFFFLISRAPGQAAPPDTSAREMVDKNRQQILRFSKAGSRLGDFPLLNSLEGTSWDRAYTIN